MMLTVSTVLKDDINSVNNVKKSPHEVKPAQRGLLVVNIDPSTASLQHQVQSQG